MQQQHANQYIAIDGNEVIAADPNRARLIEAEGKTEPILELFVRLEEGLHAWWVIPKMIAHSTHPPDKLTGVYQLGGRCVMLSTAKNLGWVRRDPSLRLG